MFAANTKKPALGPSFTFVTDGSLWLTKHAGAGDDGGEVFTAEVLRSRTHVSLSMLHHHAGLIASCAGFATSRSAIKDVVHLPR